MKKRIISIVLCLAMVLALAPINVLAASKTISSNATWTEAIELSSDETWTLENGAVVTLEKTVTIHEGTTLILKGWGSFARSNDNTGQLFIVEKGSKLIIEGMSSEKPLIIDGKNVIAKKPLITSKGELDFKYAVIQNGKNRSTQEVENKETGEKKDVPNGAGGGIFIAKEDIKDEDNKTVIDTITGSLKMDHCFVTKNTSSVNGGGIYSYGPVTISNSTISDNRAMFTETSDGGVNAGRGGGFFFSGDEAICSFDNTYVSGNAAMYYGGGGHIQSSAKLTMKEGTVFENNTAVLHGAAALHVTDKAYFVMDGGIIQNNNARTVGGAIHSSYTCVLELKKGQILNNKAGARGGGINVNTGGNITLGEGVIISGNEVDNLPRGSAAVVDPTGDNWTDVEYNSEWSDNGFGGGVAIDSATCTVSGATITGNHAAVGGGGIALVMINATVFDHIGDLRPVKFTMTSGDISQNTTDGNGAGVYMMSNKIKETILAVHGNNDETSEEYQTAIAKLQDQSYLTEIPEASVSGGSIKNNTATQNGGGLYLCENTKFAISGTGDISQNTAVDGAGVYVASGTAEINGGTMSENEASSEGGALYVAGEVTMTDGKITGNEAVENGGGIYITEVGETNSKFTMTSGSMTENKATGAKSNGGGVYVEDGDIIIGVEKCTGEGTNHTSTYTDKPHPVIKSNSAVDSGGGIALIGNGNITMYCGDIEDNEATNRGRGKNVYMEGGIFDHYAGRIGDADGENPELVIVGGELIDRSLDESQKINLTYYHCNVNSDKGNHIGDLDEKVATATKDAWFNLPDGEKYWTAKEGFRFVGWSFNGPSADPNADELVVHDKEDYEAMGEPIKAIDNYNEPKDDNNIDLYALWAPETSKITYVGSVIDGEYESDTLDMPADQPTTYSFELSSSVKTIKAPSKPGYTFLGWYIYQDWDNNANWGYQPFYKEDTTDKVYANLDFDKLQKLEEATECIQSNADGSCNIDMGNTNFGDLTLIARFERAYTDLTVKKEVSGTVDANQSFIFELSGNPADNDLKPITMTFTLKGGESEVIGNLPVGEYTIKELTDWSWRYGTTTVKLNSKEAVEKSSLDLSLDNPNASNLVTFTNTLTDNKWLSFTTSVENIFDIPKNQ